MIKIPYFILSPILSFAICILPIASLLSQAPLGFNYQAVARNSTDEILQDRNISIRFTITNENGGAVQYQEIHSATTNQFGLFTLQVGKGASSFGNFSTIHWSEINAWLQVEIDPNGGTSFINMGTSQLLSVPYALFAASGTQGPQGPQGPAGILSSGNAAGNTPYWNGTTWVLNSSNIYNNGDKIGIGTSAPGAKLEINGQLKITGGSPGAGKILTSDASGLASWQTSTSGMNGSGEPDYLAKFDSPNTLRSSVVYDDGSNVGIGTDNPDGKVHIKGTENMSQLIIDASNNQSNSSPLILLRNHNGNDLMWIHSDLNSNCFIGYGTGANNTGGTNCAFGSLALAANEGGGGNTAIGKSALASNTDGHENVAVGVSALQSNTSGAINVAIGHRAAPSMVSGFRNVAIGTESLSNNQTGKYNTAVGDNSLYSATGDNNVGVGEGAGTFMTGDNNIAIGYHARVPNSAGDNQAVFGGDDITYAGVKVAWTISSDRRWKSDIHDSNLGLDFISKLRPVSYYRTNDESKKREYGFIAQELEEALNTSGASDNGIISKDDHGMYGVRYNDLMTPMVKAIQELTDQNKTQQELIEQQNLVIENLLSRIEALEKK